MLECVWRSGRWSSECCVHPPGIGCSSMLLRLTTHLHFWMQGVHTKLFWFSTAFPDSDALPSVCKKFGVAEKQRWFNLNQSTDEAEQGPFANCSICWGGISRSVYKKIHYYSGHLRVSAQFYGLALFARLDYLRCWWFLVSNLDSQSSENR